MAKAEQIKTGDAAVDAAVEKAKPVGLSRFGLANEVRNVWRLTCEASTTPEQVVQQHYWANVSMHLRPGDLIEVIPDDMKWEMHLRVLGAGRLFAHVAKTFYTKLEAAVDPILLPSIYKVEHAGAHHKWRVVRDGHTLKDGFETEAIARRYAANHEAAVSR